MVYACAYVWVVGELLLLLLGNKTWYPAAKLEAGASVETKLGSPAGSETCAGTKLTVNSAEKL